MLFWQGPTALSAHFSTGLKDAEASRIFYEPLANWTSDGTLVPVLAAEIPSRENGRLAADGKSVTWKIKPGVTWHDGRPLTADDLVFTWQFVGRPGLGLRDAVDLQRRQGREGRRPHRQGAVRPADALLGQRLRGGERRGAAPARLRPLHRREVARSARQPRAGRHRPLQLRRVPPRRHAARDALRGLPPAEPALISTPSSSRAAATPCRPPAPCCRRATTTTPTAWRSRTRC